jgi:acyl-CoA thioesterase FadM
MGLVVKSVLVEYKRPVTFPDSVSKPSLQPPPRESLLYSRRISLHDREQLVIMSRPINIDPEKSSFGLRQAAWSLEQGRIVAECTSVQVMYDFKGLKKGVMTQEVREALEAIAGRCLQSTDA